MWIPLLSGTIKDTWRGRFRGGSFEPPSDLKFHFLGKFWIKSDKFVITYLP